MAETLLRQLLDEDVWDKHAGRIEKLKSWEHYALLLSALEGLMPSALYQSPIHGQDHIERTLLFAALLALGEGVTDRTMVRQLLGCACYHDVGRVRDNYETGHGARSARQLGELTGFEGELLRQMQGAVAAHSWPDRQMERIVGEYAPVNPERAMELARLLKDADGLDRPRIGDLNVRFMRHDTARELVECGFAEYVYELYSERLHLPPPPLRGLRRRQKAE
ncbi:MAG: hypothetical protein IJG63_04875 [Oscillospiraceae bacterium]|nr:hypothetical protein [Oscillospiraceae bacterium]